MESYNSGFTQKEVENIKSGIIEEFNKSEHLDNSNVDLLTGQNYTVNLQINLHPVDSKKEAITKSWKYHDDPFNSAMLLEKAEETLVTLPEGSAGIMKGAATYGRLRISGGNNHNNIHELFHNLIHNHQNASEANKKLINPKDQEAGHAKAEGIFIYENEVTGVNSEDLNQKNIDDTIQTLPEVK